jgi:nucleotide-binding universal stress UspA family protein
MMRAAVGRGGIHIRSSPFPIVVCGIDGTREAYEGARQAARIAGPGGRLVLVAATHFLDAVGGRWGPELIPWSVLDTPQRDLGELNEAVRDMARDSLDWARRQVGDAVEVETRVVNGRAHEELRGAATEEGANLIVIGSHGGRRLVGAALGRVATMLLHEGPTSVLLARPPFDPAAFPSRVTVGLDGSDAALHALGVAARLCEHPASALTAVVATGDEAADVDDLRRRAAPHRLVVDRGRPVDALIDEASRCDLLVVGARGIGGVRALGSVSERVAHRAASSVLVVRHR